MRPQPVLAFDLVGTLLDLSGLDPVFRREFGSSRVRHEWFAEALKLAFSITAANGYASFSEITRAALNIIEERYRVELPGSRRKHILEGLLELAPFLDVKPALESLRSSGWRMVVLTNSTAKAARQALQTAGLAEFFEEILSAEMVQRLKPAPEPYRMAAKKCGRDHRDLLLIAAHSWDVRGAIGAGCAGCFVHRPEQVLDELTPAPHLVVEDLHQLSVYLQRKSRAS